MACYEFAQVMQEGDIIITKRGTTHYLGWGIVRSPYYYDEDAKVHSHKRRVEWMKKGEWYEANIVTKTLTNISKYPWYVKRLDDMLGIMLPFHKSKDSDNMVVEQAEKHNKPYSREDALRELFMSEDEFDRIVRVLKSKKNIVLQGPPGVGKTYAARRIAKAIVGADDERRIASIQFHQSYSYEDFIQGIRPSSNGGFSVRKGIFYDFCERAQRDPQRPYIFIIDEINRGNLSKIFGELMLLMEQDKRGKSHQILLTYSEQDEFFYIPENVHIIGAMNTADRSLAMVDYALRRRFSFFNLLPTFNEKLWLNLDAQGLEKPFIDLIYKKITELNKEIGDDQNLGDGFKIGHSYFCNALMVKERKQTSQEWFLDILDLEIAPQLREYWFDKMEKAEDMIESLRKL